MPVSRAGSIMYCRCGHVVGCNYSPPLWRGKGGGSAVYYMQLAMPNVVAIAVSTVITMLRILPQVELLLKVPIVVKVRLEIRV